MIIGFFPLILSDRNSYISRIIEAIRKAYPDVVIKELPSIRNSKAIDEIDVAWLNWFENLSSNKRLFVKNLISRLALILLLKIKRKKIVSVVHNKKTHESHYSFIEMFFFKTQLRLSNKIITLCGEGKSVIRNLIGGNYLGKTFVVSHPTYICAPKCYKEESHKGDFTVLFFGLIRPYKNIEAIIDIASRYNNIKFVIAGQPITEEYGKLIQQKCEILDNVMIDLKYQSDNELNDLMDKASVVLLPYNTSSSLNSGVAMYALSKGVNIVIPEIGTIKDLNNKVLVYCYSEKDSMLIRQSMMQAILQAYEEYNNDYSLFINKAKILREEVLCNNSIENIANQIRSLGL